MRSDNQQRDRFFELLEPEFPRLQAFCQKLAGDSEMGKDLVQDALYDAWKGFAQLRQAESFKPWLYQVTVYRYRTNLRKFRKRADLISPLTGDVVDDRQSRLQVARDRLNFAMACLSAKDRALVTLHELEGWSYSELATMFGRSEGALRARLTRCRHRMRRTLERLLEETDEGLNTMGVGKQWIVAKQKRS
jgi:RNA polymerase sigma-70 factor (ECF subfamily)